MDIELYIIILFVSIIQALFGVGVLLFGTPLLLIWNYPFKEVLIILLPISLTISFSQVLINFKDIDLNFYLEFLKFSILPVIIFLFYGLSFEVDFNFIIGVILISFSLKDYLKIVGNVFMSISKMDKLNFIFMGIVHGLTNLGGSILSAVVFNKALSRNKTRSNIAICYATFALFQLGTLALSFNLNRYFDSQNIVLILIAFLSFIVTQKYVFLKISKEKYEKSFSVFLFTSGISIIIKKIGFF